MIFEDRVLTFAALDRQAAAVAALLPRLGYEAGARIAYLGRNSEIYFSVLFGCLRAGLVLVPLNWRCAAPELGFIISEAGARLVICDTDLQALAAASGVAALLPIDGKAGLREMLWKEVPVVDWTVDPDAPAILMFTSGTTGKPKGVILTQRTFALARQAELVSTDYSDWSGDDVILSAMPNFHMAACSWILSCVVRGLTCVITGDPTPQNLLALCRDHGVTRTFIVPTVVRALLEEMRAQQVSLPTLREIQYGAAPMDVDLLQRSMDEIGCGFLQHYGMTEATGSATRLPPADHDIVRPHLLRSVGKPLPGISLEIRRADGTLALRDEPGEIWINSPTLMPGYWQQPKATADALQDGWYRSGDGGFLDDDGYLFLTDRIKDMIVSGGENIYPVEVEAALRTHPSVFDVAVFGLPDDRWGEKVVAAIELRPNAVVTPEDLGGYARTLIAGYKAPKQYIFDLELPRTATGKVQRGAARATVLASG